jgi:hypothetical protein
VALSLIAVSAVCGDDAWVLTIHRTDGSEQRIEFDKEPVVCGGSPQSIVYLCGTKESHAVDFIPVNVAAGETYEISSP